MGDEREGKGQKQHYHPSLSFKKSKEKEWERGMRKRKGAKLLWILFETLQPHAEETIIIEVMENFLTPSGSPRHRHRFRFGVIVLVIVLQLQELQPFGSLS